MHEETEKFISLLKRSRVFHTALYQALLEARDLINAGKVSRPEDLVDLGYLFREIAALGDDIRKEYEELQRVAARATCLLWVVRSLSDPTIGKSVSGTIATGTPDVKTVAQLPARGTDGYKALMGYLCVPADLVEKDVVKIHWPHFQSLVGDLASQGKPLPPGIDPSKTFDDYRVTLRKKKDADKVLGLEK